MANGNRMLAPKDYSAAPLLEQTDLPDFLPLVICER